MIAVSVGQTNIFLFRKVNTWFSVKDGNWSDPNTWVSNALDKKFYTSPQPGDNVWINNNVVCDINATVGNLYGNGYLSLAANIILTVNGDIQITGTVDQTAINNNLILNGYNNVIVNYISSFTGVMTYNGLFTQYIMNLPYGSLTTSNTGNRFLTANTTISGNLSVYNLECLTYNLTVNGATTIPNNNTGNFSKNGAGSLLFIGQFSQGENSTINWTGNPNVEFRGGINHNSYTFNTGTGTFSFTTNNQNIKCGANVSGVWSAPILISGAITITNISGSNLNSFSTIINGNNVASKLSNQGTITLNTNTVPMATGIFDYMNTTGSTMGYSSNISSYVLPYSTYANLTTNGSVTNIKSLRANTIVNGNLNVASGSFDCVGYNLTVNGATSISNGVDGSAFKTSASGGSLLFIGQFGNGVNTGIDFTVGNPNVECRGGFSVNAYFINSGTGIWSFTTNDQTINITANNTGTFNAPVLISGAITVTYTGTAVNIFNGAINGNNANSTLVNKGTFVYANAQQPMQTGKLYCNQTANTFIYGLAGNQDITTPSDPVSPGYQNLILNGSGAKRLLGNVSVKAVYTLTPPATLNSNGFSLTNP